MVKKSIPLYVGLATGFCGSFTSFSAFVRDAFLALSNHLPGLSSAPVVIPSRNGGYGFEALMAVLILHVAVSLAAFQLGVHLAAGLDPFTPTIPFAFLRRVLDPLVVFLAFGCWVGAVVLSVFGPRPAWRGQATFALVFAPVGCLLRYYCSKYLNPRFAAFPLGTFVANVVGTVILAVCYDLQHALVADLNTCRVLQGVMEGLCGCGTTVSTWVAELHALKTRDAYVYAVVSVGVALGFLLVIMGSLEWTRGFQQPVCIDL